MCKYLLIFGLILSFHQVEAALGDQSYFRFVEIEQLSSNDEDQTYLYRFTPYGDLKVPLEKGKGAFIVEQKDELGGRRSIMKVGPDLALIWQADFHGNGQLKKFIQYRREDTRLAQWNPNFFESRFDFHPDGKLARRSNMSLRTDYYYHPQSRLLLRELFFEKGSLKNSNYFVYKNNILIRINQFETDPIRNNEVLSGFTLVNTHAVKSIPDFKGEATRKKILKHHDHDGRFFKEEVFYYKQNKILVRDISDGTREIFDYEVKEKSGPLKSIILEGPKKSQIYKKIAVYYFPKYVLPDHFYLNLKAELIKVIHNTAYRPNNEKVTQRESISRFNRMGHLVEEMELYKKEGKLQELTKQQPGLNKYKYLFDKKNRIIEKRIVDKNERSVGHYRYAYNANDQLTTETFYDGEEKVHQLKKYFYTKNYSPLAYAENGNKVFQQYYSEAFQLNYRAVINEVKERFGDHRNKLREMEKEDKLRKENIQRMYLAHLMGLSKIITYDRQRNVTSYIRLFSKDEASKVKMNIHFYNRAVDFDFKYNKGGQIYQNQPFFYKGPKDKNYVDPAGHEREFHAESIDHVDKNLALYFEPLKQSYTLVYDEAGNIYDLKEVHYQTRTRKVVSKIGLTEDRKIVSSRPKNDVELAELNYFRALTRQANQ